MEGKKAKPMTISKEETTSWRSHSPEKNIPDPIQLLTRPQPNPSSQLKIKKNSRLNGNADEQKIHTSESHSYKHRQNLFSPPFPTIFDLIFTHQQRQKRDLGQWGVVIPSVQQVRK
jgi:hypothetical protein